MFRKNSLFAALAMCIVCMTYAQSPFKGYENMFTPPLSYVAGYAKQAPVIDGKLDDEAWAKAEWTSYFQDIEGNLKPKPYYDTRAKMLWDDKYLYVAAELKDPHVWATLTKRDEIVFFDNDFEIFINPSNNTHSYFEVEINALNNIFDLFLAKPYRNGGSALFSWDAPGMLHAVDIKGTLNNPNDTDEGWTVEFAIPFSAISMGNHVNVPKDGEIWRINYSRVQWDTDIVDGKYVKRKDANGKGLPENNWVWSAQGMIDMHRPERWGYLQFSKNEVGTKLPSFELPYTEKQKQYLWLVYYKQKDFMNKHKRYASSLKELGLDTLVINIDKKLNKLAMTSTPNQFRVGISDDSGKKVSVNDEGLIMK